MSDKVALVTGSTSGIARALAAVDVMLNGFGGASAIERTRGGIAGAFGARAACSGADVGRPDQIEAMFAQAEVELGRVDILVNNAGFQHAAPVKDFPLDRWEAIIAINLTAEFVATKAALPGMLARGWGRVVNIASTHGLVASPLKSADVAAKHGIVGPTKVAALETATTGVTCNAICPGWVLTPLVQKQTDARAASEGIPADKAKFELLAEKQPSHEFVTPEQLGQLAVLLCSDAAAQVRGQAMAVDGGWTAQ